MQAFLSNALARAASADDADAVTSVQVDSSHRATVFCLLVLLPRHLAAVAAAPSFAPG